MFGRNQDIKDAQIIDKKKRVPNYAIAEKLGISDNSFYCLMRKELSKEKKQEILNAISEIKQELAKVQ